QAVRTTKAELKNPIAELSLFNPGASMAALPQLEQFDRWSNSETGRSLVGGVLENEESRWIGLFRNIDVRNPNPDQLSQISPVIQQLHGDAAVKARLEENLRKLAEDGL